MWLIEASKKVQFVSLMTFKLNVPICLNGRICRLATMVRMIMLQIKLNDKSELPLLYYNNNEHLEFATCSWSEVNLGGHDEGKKCIVFKAFEKLGRQMRFVLFRLLPLNLISHFRHISQYNKVIHFKVTFNVALYIYNINLFT